jgi:hypothetical protein
MRLVESNNLFNFCHFHFHMRNLNQSGFGSETIEGLRTMLGLSVADPDPGSGIGFFRIPDPRPISLRA